MATSPASGSEPPSSTYAPERRRLIARIVAEQGRASIVDLARRFAVSEVTIRKDVTWLEDEGRLVRTHGGAISLESGRSEAAFDVRDRMQRTEKAAIGAAAAEMVGNGVSIALDASTTALQLARRLRNHRELTVVTNGMRTATELAAMPGMTVLMPGGRIRPEAFSLVSLWAEPLMPAVNIDTAFVGAVGLTLENGLTDVTHEEAAMKKVMVAAARRVVALVDHSKWGRVAIATFCPLESLDTVITDAAAPADLVAQLRDRGITVIQVEEQRPPRSDRATNPRPGEPASRGRPARPPARRQKAG